MYINIYIYIYSIYIYINITYIYINEPYMVNAIFFTCTCPVDFSVIIK